MEYIVFNEINKITPGRDLLLDNKEDHPMIESIAREILYSINGTEFNDNFEITSEAFDLWSGTPGFTADIQEDYFKFAIGWAPRYEYEDLFIIIIEEDITKSRIVHGKATGPYGSGIKSVTETYPNFADHINLSIKEWHSMLTEYAQKFRVWRENERY